MLKLRKRNMMIFLTTLLPFTLFASDGSQINIIDTLWVLIAGFLVFFMNAGFAFVETGFTRAKNTVNILAKNFIVFAIATVVFWAVGYGFMFGEGNSIIGLSSFLVKMTFAHHNTT
ncbi:MAG: hypothetical protein N2053_03580 [Chitinispirillaceae bacterium]|nr:hypothetical protein [Chitinispirillaceae bacterium]